MIKNRFVLIIVLSGSLLAHFSCKSELRTDTAQAAAVPDTIRLEPVSTEGNSIFEITQGTIYWSAKKTLGGPQNGTISVKKGELVFDKVQLRSGTIELDMGSLVVVNLKDAGEKADLESHLKDADFFEVGRYPTGTFRFHEVLPSNLPAFNYVLSGQLELKGKTNPVNVPVKLTVSNDRLTADTPSFPINRTQWGINFRSGTLGTAKDKLIEDVVLLSVKVEGRKVGRR